MFFEKQPRCKLTNLVITNIFCQSLDPSLYIKFPLYLIVFIFLKSGVCVCVCGGGGGGGNGARALK